MTMTTAFEHDWSDQTGIFDPTTFVERVVIIGCGGIGASLLPTLVTMGVTTFELFDPDTVEPRNIASQLLFCPADIYRPKVEVTAEYLKRYGAENVVTHQELFTAETPLEGSVVIGAVDTMAARQAIWQAVTRSPSVQLYLDGRIGGEFFSCFSVEPLDGDWYEKHWLFDDEAAAPLPCTERAIVYPAAILGGIMCAHLAHWHGGEKLSHVVHGDMKCVELTEVNY